MTLDSGGKDFFQPAGLHAVVGLRNPRGPHALDVPKHFRECATAEAGASLQAPQRASGSGSNGIAGIDSDPSSGGCATFSMTGVVSVRRPRSD